MNPNDDTVVMAIDPSMANQQRRTEEIRHRIERMLAADPLPTHRLWESLMEFRHLIRSRPGGTR